MRNVTKLAALLLAAVPTLTHAQEFGWAEDVITGIGELLGLAVPVLIAIALALFIWGLLGYFLSSDSDSDRAESKWRMIWGILMLFVIVTVWGLVVLLNELTGVEPVNDIEAPQSEF